MRKRYLSVYYNTKYSLQDNVHTYHLAEFTINKRRITPLIIRFRYPESVDVTQGKFEYVDEDLLCVDAQLSTGHVIILCDVAGQVGVEGATEQLPQTAVLFITKLSQAFYDTLFKFVMMLL